MSKYFFIINDEQVGPVEYEAISNLNIDEDTMSWTKGMKEWEKASSIKELHKYLGLVPPPIPEPTPPPIPEPTPPSKPEPTPPSKPEPTPPSDPVRLENARIFAWLITIAGIAYFLFKWINALSINTAYGPLGASIPYVFGQLIGSAIIPGLFWLIVILIERSNKAIKK